MRPIEIYRRTERVEEWVRNVCSLSLSLSPPKRLFPRQKQKKNYTNRYARSSGHETGAGWPPPATTTRKRCVNTRRSVGPKLLFGDIIAGPKKREVLFIRVISVSANIIITPLRKLRLAHVPCPNISVRFKYLMAALFGVPRACIFNLFSPVAKIEFFFLKPPPPAGL